MGLVSGWSLADHSDSGSFLGAHASLSQDRTGRLAEHIMGYFLLVLFGPSQILPVGFVGGSSVLCSLLGPHVVPGRAPPRHAHGDLTSLALHERLPEILVVPREKTPTGAAARGNP